LSGYLRPTAPIAADALLVADPGAAMAVAQVVLEKPLMANHHHGLWGYSGTTHADRALTVQSTGIGGPSTAAVAAELHAHGMRRAIRVAAASALAPSPAAGTTIVADSALGLDGTSSALGIARPTADVMLTAALAELLAADRVVVAGHDLAGLSAPADLQREWLVQGASVVDGETAALLAIAQREGFSAAAALVVDPVDDGLVELAGRAVAAFTS
jgi:uridine phosphorylase